MESPLDAINISFPFLQLSLPLFVDLNLFLLLSASKCYPVTCRGEIQPSQAQIEQGREERQALRQKKKGKEGRRKAERRRRGVRSSCRVPCGRLVDGVSLSLSLPPLLNTKPCTALQKIGVWRIPTSFFFFLSPSLLCSLQTPSHCLSPPPLWFPSLLERLSLLSNAEQI